VATADNAKVGREGGGGVPGLKDITASHRAQASSNNGMDGCLTSSWTRAVCGVVQCSHQSLSACTLVAAVNLGIWSVQI